MMEERPLFCCMSCVFWIVNADVYKQGAERTAAIANCLNTVLILGCCVNICSAGRTDGLLTLYCCMVVASR